MNFIVENIKASVTGIRDYLAVPSGNNIWDKDCIVSVEYEALIQQASWGIKSIDVFISRIKGEIKYDVDNDDPSKSKGVIDIYVTNGSSDWKIESSVKPRIDGELLIISECEIDLKNNVIKVS